MNEFIITAITDFIRDNWLIILPTVWIIADKIVKSTKSPYDDFLLDKIIKPLVKLKTKKKNIAK